MMRVVATLVGLLVSVSGAGAVVESHDVWLAPGASPSRIAQRLELQNPQFASLRPYPGLTEVYFVAGGRDGSDFSALLVHSNGSQSLITIPPTFVVGSDSRVAVSVPISSTPPLSAVLTLVAHQGEPRLSYSWPEAATSPGTARLHQVLPSLVVSDLSGRSNTLASLAFAVMVVNYWSSWCAPCIEEIPDLNLLAAEFRGDPRVGFVAISPEDSSAVERAIARLPFTFTHFVSPQAETVFGESLPRHLVLDSQMRVVFDSSGYGLATLTELRRAVTTALLQSAGNAVEGAPNPSLQRTPPG